MSFTNSGSAGTVTYSDGMDAAASLGQSVWNHIDRMNPEESTRFFFSAVGLLGSIITMGVNLAVGAKNMKRSNTSAKVTMTIKNYTDSVICLYALSNVQNSVVRNMVFDSGESIEIDLTNQSFAGYGNGDNGPKIHFKICNGSEVANAMVQLIDNTHDSFSGQIRIRKVIIEDIGMEDHAGGDKSSQDMRYPFYTFTSATAKPSFKIYSTTVSDGSRASISLLFSN